MPAHREQLLKCFPRDMKCLEVGVQNGNFSAMMLERLSPSQLHLVDPWQHFNDEKYDKDYANVAQIDQDNIFSRVVDRFKSDKRVFIHREASPSASKSFSDGFFDFIYIDGMHYKDAVLTDLKAWIPKLKPGGIIAGHDFANHSAAQSMGFGVIEAVLELLNTTNFHIHILSGGYRESFPSYFLCEEASPAWIDVFERQLYEEKIPVLELPSNLLSSFSFRKQMCYSQIGFVPRFGYE